MRQPFIFSMGKKGHGFIFLLLAFFLFRSKTTLFIHLHTSVTAAHPSEKSGHTTAPHCPATMCAFGSTLASVTHYKTLHTLFK